MEKVNIFSPAGKNRPARPDGPETGGPGGLGGPDGWGGYVHMSKCSCLRALMLSRRTSKRAKRKKCNFSWKNKTGSIR